MADVTLAPVTAKARIDVLDILRGLAILGIFFMNIPFMGAPVLPTFADIRLIGWTPFDAAAWSIIDVALEGTQRCMLEFLFGAGMLIITARAMTRDAPIAVADLYLRRTMWLGFFGLFDIFVLLWPGDILFIYAVAAMFLLPFRRLDPRWLVTIGMTFAVVVAVMGGVEYAGRVNLQARVASVEARQAKHVPLTAADKATMDEWRKVLDRRQVSPELKAKIAEEKKAHAGGLIPYAQFYWKVWAEELGGVNGLLPWVAEAFCAMLIGMALFKWRIIQGGRDAGFYLRTGAIAYAVALTIRIPGVAEALTFSFQPKIIWLTSEFGRLAMGLGHVCLVNLIVKAAFGRTLLAPFKAVGRMAFSIYFLEQIIGLWILFAPFGLNLWGRWSWGGLAVVAMGVYVFNIIVANLWMTYFSNGPMEWAWRSLAYLKLQPLRRPTAKPTPAVDAAPMPA